MKFTIHWPYQSWHDFRWINIDLQRNEYSNPWNAMNVIWKCPNNKNRGPLHSITIKNWIEHRWQIVIVPSPGSIWDYPYLNQVSSMMGLVYGTGPDPKQDFLPPNSRFPPSHVNIILSFPFSSWDFGAFTCVLRSYVIYAATSSISIVSNSFS